ncbi:uncharacterized protein LOC120152444 [Hibiscus syriacus]|uniref:uncharacterized protein LOC120152444 n=1 Tax=Hibiscus syriacus TaxID=106335 RepID=UPI00192109CD|nr:uncharacterized protein LOC120152444 [Hibiscus syriacus]
MISLITEVEGSSCRSPGGEGDEKDGKDALPVVGDELAFHQYANLGFIYTAGGTVNAVNNHGSSRISWVISTNSSSSSSQRRRLLKLRPAAHHLFVNRDKELSTRQIWEAIRPEAPKVVWHHLVWFVGRIPKYCIILWMVILDRLPTRIRLLRMGFAIDNDKCLLCNLESETRNHLFFECDYAGNLWKAILQLCGVNRRASHWDGELAWATHCFKGKSLITRVLKLALSSHVYWIWKERNDRLFGGVPRPWSTILEDVKAVVRIRLRGCSINVADPRNATLCASWNIA